jgi:hypothetical protein
MHYVSLIMASDQHDCGGILTNHPQLPKAVYHVPTRSIHLTAFTYPPPLVLLLNNALPCRQELRYVGAGTRVRASAIHSHVLLLLLTQGPLGKAVRFQTLILCWWTAVVDKYFCVCYWMFSNCSTDSNQTYNAQITNKCSLIKFAWSALHLIMTD